MKNPLPIKNRKDPMNYKREQGGEAKSFEKTLRIHSCIIMNDTALL